MLLREEKKSETADPNDISTGTCQKTKGNAEPMMTTFPEQQFPFWALSASKVTRYDIYRLRTVSAPHPQSTSRPRRSHRFLRNGEMQSLMSWGQITHDCHEGPPEQAPGHVKTQEGGCN